MTSLFIALFLVTTVESDFQVIVHPKNDSPSVRSEFVARAFLKKTTRWPDGTATHPVDLSPEARIRGVFSRAILKRSVGAVKSYWTQRVFSGRGVPPPEMSTEEAVIAYVLRTPGAIGYVSKAADLRGARTLPLEE